MQTVLLCFFVSFLVACQGNGATTSNNGLSKSDLGTDGTTLDDVNITDTNGGACLSDEHFFARDLWAKTLEPVCFGCHVEGGLASESGMLFAHRGRPDAMQYNRTALAGYSTLFLSKASGMDHGGGAVVEEGDVHFQRLEQWASRLETPTICDEDNATLADLELESRYHSLRRFALYFGSRLPTQDEIKRVDEGDDTVLKSLFEEIQNEETFGRRMAEGYNDLFLTQGADVHIAGFSTVNHPSLLWFNALTGEARSEALDSTHAGVRNAPTELVNHIIVNDLPFSDILLAEYSMVNPQSARSFGVFDDIQWNDPNDATEFHPAKLPTMESLNGKLYPHAGMLTDYAYLVRYPSTPTNLGRARARAYLLHFLGTDILKFAPLNSDPLAIDEQYENPIRDAADCAVCHVTLDPIAGLFGNYHNVGSRNRGAIPEDTFPAGFEIKRKNGEWTDVLPEERKWNSLRWLAERTVDDSRFALAMVEHFYTITIGRKPMRTPTDGEPTQRYNAYNEQRTFLFELSKEFAQSNFDAKNIIIKIAMSPYFRAGKIPAGSDAERWFDIGSAQILMPEHLHRKIIAVFGSSFRIFLSENPLIDRSRLMVLYGGIDSDTVTLRILQPNGVLAAIQHLVGNAVSCDRVSAEFAASPTDRVLFSNVELTDFGSESETKIRETLVHLHERILGERLTVDDPEITASFELFEQVRKEGVQQLADGNVTPSLSSICNPAMLADDTEYVQRAWSTLLRYLILDYEFLYE